MSAPSQAKVMLATLTKCTSARGTTYLRGWLGASNLIAFAGEPDDQGRPTWNLYLIERTPRDRAPADPKCAPSPHPQPRRPIPPASAGARAEPPPRRSASASASVDAPTGGRRHLQL